MPRGHKLTLRVKSSPVSRDGGVETCQVQTDLLVDGKRVGLVQQFGFALSAEHPVPVVFLKLIPGELDIEIESPAVFHAALAEVQSGFMHGLDGSVAVGVPVRPPEPPPAIPLDPPGTPEELKAAWEKAFGKFDGAAADETAARLRAPARPAEACEQESDRIWREAFGPKITTPDAAVETFEEVRRQIMNDAQAAQTAQVRAQEEMSQVLSELAVISREQQLDALKGLPGGTDVLGRTPAAQVGPASPAPLAPTVRPGAGFQALDSLVARGDHLRPITLHIQGNTVTEVTPARPNRPTPPPGD